MLYQTNALKNFCFTDSPLDREQKKQAIKQQAARLEKLQLLVKQSALPVIVLVEGWGTAGKGSRIASMIAPMDPRFFEVISVPSPTPEELAKPFLYRHMKNIPENGKFRLDGPDHPRVSVGQLLGQGVRAPSGGNLRL